MKIRVSQRKSERANVLIIALIIMGIAGFTLLSYLNLSDGQSKSVMRSQSWNGTVPIVEAGIEEAMTHLNDDCSFTDIQHPSTNWWGTNGWTQTDMGVTKTTTLPGGASYTMEILTASPFSTWNPMVTCQGNLPSLAGTVSGPFPFFAQIGGTTTSTVQNTNVARKVEVRCGTTAIFNKGLLAKNTIDMHGNNVSSDSFDSTDPAYSTGGLYDPTKNKCNGDIATTSGLQNSINVGNANIHGSISTAPGGSVAIGANGTVGDCAWAASNTGIEPGHFADDLNIYLPDVQVPFTGGYYTPTNGFVTNDTRFANAATNTVTTWPAGQDPIITNTVTVTTTAFPAAGTYLGTPSMNTTPTTTTSPPADGTYVGVIVTNTVNATSGSIPGSGVVGGVVTNTTLTTSSSYPSAGTYIGLVTTNTTPTTSGGYPSAGSYVGSVTTNCSATVTQNKNPPAAGTYCGTPWKTGNGSGNNSAWNWYAISGYSYAQITGYTYNKISGYSYQEISSYTYDLITGWTWAQIVSYTYYTYSTTVTTNAVSYYDEVLGNGNYEVADLTGNVIVTGNAVLYVTDAINTQSITIAPGGSLKLYTSANSVDLGGNGVWNEAGNATNFMYYGLPGNTGISLSGNASFTGTIYAPEADLTLNGGGHDTTDFIGAAVTKSATLNGHFNFHYDEGLRKEGPTSVYAINSWNEIPLTQRY